MTVESPGWTNRLVSAIFADVQARNVIDPVPLLVGPRRVDAVRKGVWLTPFGVTNEGKRTHYTVLGLQLWFRVPDSEGAGGLLDLSDAMYDYWDSVEDRDYDGTIISGAWRDRSVPLGLDSRLGYEHTDTYYVHTHR